jgi:hypothetical protein
MSRFDSCGLIFVVGHQVDTLARMVLRLETNVTGLTTMTTTTMLNRVRVLLQAKRFVVDITHGPVHRREPKYQGYSVG